MERELTFTLLICVALAVAGCGESNTTSGAGGSAGIGGIGGIGGNGGAGGEGGSGGVLGTPALDPLDGTPRYAVVSSDFSSTSIAMLDEDFAVIDESWLNSGTTYPGLVATLSGDVVLPSRQAGDGTFAVIDRFSTDVVTRFFVPSGNLNGQVRTHGEVGETGFSSNPQGNDLFEINPSDMSATGARIDLSSLNTTATVMTQDGPVEVDVFARPSRGVLVGSTIVVGLDRISASFDAAGPGMVAVIDLEDESVEGLELTGLASCGNAMPVPGAPTKVVVACVGFAQPFGDEPQVRASSGIVLLDVGETDVTIERLWRVSDHPAAAIAVNSVAAIDEQRVVGVATGDFATTVDMLYLTNLATEAQELVRESTGSFILGVSAYDLDSEMLYVPDAADNVVLELAASEGG
ncbi:MAG: hypothetical protein JRI98_11875, partial [Deltaproteobacteria bacterium]|nr:hypothetical protein [Deltaproteobacteria bacterium]